MGDPQKQAIFKPLGSAPRESKAVARRDPSFAWAALISKGRTLVHRTAAMYQRNILVEQTDPEVWAAIQAENLRQEEHIELIASETTPRPPSWRPQGPS